MTESRLRNSCVLRQYASQPMPEQQAKRRGRPPAGGREAILAAALELLRERGVARMTTRAVAERAGVSEASVFYHYTDRAGLLKAVFEAGVRPLQAAGEDGRISGPTPAQSLARFGHALERFLDQALPVMTAAQSDRELCDALAAYMSAEQLGPHRGVDAVAAYIADEQAAGRVRSDVEPEAIALMFVGACFLRTSQRQMPVPKVALPALERAIAALETMLRPDHGDRAEHSATSEGPAAQNSA
jgi:AcrR family transcriptional regulator